MKLVPIWQKIVSASWKQKQILSTILLTFIGHVTWASPVPNFHDSQNEQIMRSFVGIYLQTNSQGLTRLVSVMIRDNRLEMWRLEKHGPPVLDISLPLNLQNPSENVNAPRVGDGVAFNVSASELIVRTSTHKNSDYEAIEERRLQQIGDNLVFSQQNKFNSLRFLQSENLMADQANFAPPHLQIASEVYVRESYTPLPLAALKMIVEMRGESDTSDPTANQRNKITKDVGIPFIKREKCAIILDGAML